MRIGPATARVSGRATPAARTWLPLLPIGGAFGVAAARQPTVLAAALTSCFGAVCLLLVFRDLEDRVVPNRIVYPALVIVFALSPIWRGHGPLAALAGALAEATPLAAVCLFTNGGMGAGDVKMAALVGAFLGYTAALVALAVAGIAGGITAAGLVALRSPQQATLPYAPFLAIGASVVLLLR